MPLGEFELIERFFSAAGRASGRARSDVLIGVGDDGALIAPPAGAHLVAVLDTLVEGSHFPVGSPARSIGHRALAVNLSDIAAMGADPAWALLGLTLPAVDEAWLEQFALGFGSLAAEHDVALVGGDTTRGPLTITVQLSGPVPPGRALRRDGGRPGDAVFVSGSVGDARHGLALEQQRVSARGHDDARYLRERFLYPTPRIALGRQLRGLASACIDLSDGLLGDLGKLCTASGCGADIELEQLPLSAALEREVGRAQAEELGLAGGDDYELLFTVPETRLGEFSSSPASVGCARIGMLRERGQIALRRAGSVIQFSHRGYDHFSL